MPNNKVKSLRKLGKVDNVHPFSRKAKQARRALARDDRLVRTRSTHDTLKVGPLVERYLLIKRFLPSEAKVLSMPEVHSLLEKYLDRHQEEIDRLQQERLAALHGTRKPREDLLLALKDQERQEYQKHGLIIPNLMSGKVVAALREWTGDINALDRIKTILVRPPKPVVVAAMQEAENRAPPTSVGSATTEGVIPLEEDRVADGSEMAVV